MTTLINWGKIMLSDSNDSGRFMFVLVAKQNVLVIIISADIIGLVITNDFVLYT